jgi:CHAD domain-containing protein
MKYSALPYFEKEWKLMKSSLTLFLANNDHGDLHNFRVQVKKINALLILLNSAAPHLKLKKHFKPIKPIFKQAGIIRNAHINLELSKEYGIADGGFTGSQTQLMQQATIDFNTAGLQYLETLKKAYKAIKNDLPLLTPSHLNLFFESHLNQLTELTAKVRFDNRMHEARKIIKLLMYNVKIAQPAIGFNRDYANGLQNAIGNWHDNSLALLLLRKMDMTVAPAFKTLNKANQALKNEIKVMLANLYNNITIIIDLPLPQLS